MRPLCLLLAASALLAAPPRKRPPRVSPQSRAQAAAAVQAMLERTAGNSLENPAALVPFFEQLYRHHKGELEGPIRILHYGDSHTAADEFTGLVRDGLQSRFGNGGAGYTMAGRPFLGYRRLDARSTATRGWRTEGLLLPNGDGLYGLGGVRILARLPGQQVTVSADCARAEVFYLRQPGGGSLLLTDNGAAVARFSTRGETGPAYYPYEPGPGFHQLALRTLDRAPVRLFGWVTENPSGVTYESLGINGAQASLILEWDAALLSEHLARRNPALIVLAYGTNEAGNPDWTPETYRAAWAELISRLRQAVPTASILLLGPPDRARRQRGRWIPHPRLDMLVQTQRQAALDSSCAFWDLREKMGGRGTMRQWVLAGLAQYDHVHFTAPGYRLLGQSFLRDLAGSFEAFLKLRAQVADGEPTPNP